MIQSIEPVLVVDAANGRRNLDSRLLSSVSIASDRPGALETSPQSYKDTKPTSRSSSR